MTGLLPQEDVWKIKGIGDETRLAFADDLVRRELLAEVDPAYERTLPRMDADNDQLGKDLDALSGLPYLVTHEGEVQVPLVRYLRAIEAKLTPRAEADAIGTVRQAVDDRTRPVVEALCELLAALVAAAPPREALETIAGEAGVELDAYDPQRSPTSAWALALHVAARDGRLDQLLVRAARSAASPALEAALAEPCRSRWHPAVVAASPAHLAIEDMGRPPAIEWDRVVAAAGRDLESALSGLVAIDGSPGVYRPETYVPRVRLDDQFVAFRQAGARALVVAGDAGAGKTCLAVRWALDRSAAGDAVVLLRGTSLFDREPLDVVADALGIDPGVHGERWPAGVAGAAAGAGHAVYVIVDGVNEVTRPGGLTDLFDEVDKQLAAVPAPFRVVLTFTTPAWDRIAGQRGKRLREARDLYFRPEPATNGALVVGDLDDDEVRAAWERYRAVHAIPTPIDQIPPGLREQLRNPSMMVLIAETFSGQSISRGEAHAAVDLFERYLEAKTEAGGAADGDFLRRFSLAGYDKRRMPIPYGVLRDIETLSADLAEGDSPYSRMLDRAVLRQIEAKGYVPPTLVEYAISRFGAFVLAGALAQQNDSLLAAVDAAAPHLCDYPVLADTIRLLLRWRAPRPLSADDLVALGGHEHPDVREMVVEALADLAPVDGPLVADVVQRLVTCERAGRGRVRECRRTGLHAAYRVTVADAAPDLSGVFVDIAKGDDEAIRREALDILYLISRDDPEFVFGNDGSDGREPTEGLMTVAADQIELVQPRQAQHLVEFLASLSITLYTTRPGWAVGKPTSDLWHKVAVERLQISKLASPLLAPVRAMVRAIGSRQFSQRIFDGFLVDDPKSIERALDLDVHDKADFRHAIALLDPGEPLDATAGKSLAALLSSDIDVFNLLAAQVIAVHATAEDAATAPLVDDLWHGLDRDGRLWVLTSFAVLLETTPVEWVGQLEDLTRRTAAAHPEVVDGLELGCLGAMRLDQLLFPLGLAYGKHSVSMPVYTELIGGVDGGAAVPVDRVRRVVRALGKVGFHHPRTVLGELAALWDRVGEPADPPVAVVDELVRALAAIRTLHLAAVDNFLLDVRASPAFTAGVGRGIDPAPLYEQVRTLGLYNNGVHQAVCFPKMREGLLQPIYALLVDSRSLRRAVGELTHRAWDMLVAADFRLEGWAEPPCPSGPCR